MRLDQKTLLNSYLKRKIPEDLPKVISQNKQHFTCYSLKPEFIKKKVFKLFKEMGGEQIKMGKFSNKNTQ